MAAPNPTPANISFYDVSALDPSTWVPVFGNFGGPNYTGMVRNSNLTPQQILSFPVAQTQNSSGVWGNSPTDLYFNNTTMRMQLQRGNQSKLRYTLPGGFLKYEL